MIPPKFPHPDRECQKPKALQEVQRSETPFGTACVGNSGAACVSEVEVRRAPVMEGLETPILHMRHYDICAREKAGHCFSTQESSNFFSLSIKYLCAFLSPLRAVFWGFFPLSQHLPAISGSFCLLPSLKVIII